MADIGELARVLAEREGQRQAATRPVDDHEPSRLDAIARLAWLTGAGADIGSTLLNRYAVPDGHTFAGEQNPLINKIPGGLPAQLAAGAGMEILARELLKKVLAEKHPKLFDALQIGAGAVHGGFALSNLQSRSARPATNIGRE